MRDSVALRSRGLLQPRREVCIVRSTCGTRITTLIGIFGALGRLCPVRISGSGVPAFRFTAALFVVLVLLVALHVATTDRNPSFCFFFICLAISFCRST